MAEILEHNVTNNTVRLVQPDAQFLSDRQAEEAVEADRKLADTQRVQRLTAALAELDGTDVQAFLDRIDAQVAAINALTVPQSAKDVMLEQVAITRRMFKGLVAVLITTEMIDQGVPE